MRSVQENVDGKRVCRMSILAPDLLDSMRVPGRCEFCGCWCPNGREASHTFTRGMGGGSQLDIPCNLTSLCGPWERACHQSHHMGHQPKMQDLLAATAIRLRIPAPLPLAVQAVLQSLYSARRMVKPSFYRCPFSGWEWYR